MVPSITCTCPSERWYPIGVTAGPTKVHAHVAAIDPTQARKRLSERREARLHLRIVFGVGQERPDPPHAVALLRPHRQRPRRRPEPRDELPPPHAQSSQLICTTQTGLFWNRAAPSQRR